MVCSSSCWSWSRYNFSPAVEKQAATTVKDSTGALVLFPVARTSVVADPDVIKAQPLQPIYAAQGKFQTETWSSPYDLAPVFNEAIPKMIDGSYDATSAYAVAVGTGLGAEQGAQDRHVQPGAGPVDHGVEDPVHVGAGAEGQVAAVLDLVDGVVVVGPGQFLVGSVQGEAQH